MLSRSIKYSAPITLAGIYASNSVAYNSAKKDNKIVVSYISLFPSPGYMYSFDLKSGVYKDVEAVASDFFKLKKVEQLGKIADQYLDPVQRREIEKESLGDSQGFQLMFEGKEFFYGANSNRVKNTEKALESLLDQLEDGLLDKRPDHLVTTLQKTNAIFFKNISVETEPGSLRKRRGLVLTREDFGQPLDVLIKYHGGTEKDLSILYKIFERANPYDPQGPFESLNKEESAVIEKIGYLPPPSKDVPSLMDSFAKELISLYKEGKNKGNVDYIKLAVFAHQNLVKIHPFQDGNGRTARAFMNALLIQGGYCPVFFPDDDVYTAHVQKSDKEFEDFLRTSIKTSKVAFKNFCSKTEIRVEAQANELSLPIVHRKN